MPDLSVLIPARREMFLARTIQDVLEHARAETEVIAVLDGDWADPQVPDHPRLRLTHSANVIGQRAGTNLAARMSTARYVMKLDAHCALDEGFDAKLIRAAEELGPDVTQVPAQYNLHAFNWRCGTCQNESYQGPTPTVCDICKASGPFERNMLWQIRENRRTEFWRFDHDLHFNYWSEYRKRSEAKGDLVDVLSCIGACFFLSRDRYWALGGLDEEHGSWGQCGTEIACKSWLSGGRLVVNKRTWYGHMFRTQGGDFGFPYAMSGAQQDRARAHSRKLWLENSWPGQRRPLSWLVEKFAPVPGWHESVGAERFQQVTAAGHVFDARATQASTTWQTPTVGLLYYSDGEADPRILQATRDQIHRLHLGWPIVSVTLKPVDFGQNLVLSAPRGALTMFRQILMGLERLETDWVFFCEHDCLYHPSHFRFRPPSRDRFWYNEYRWQVDAKTGRAATYWCCQTANLCADRELLIAHYRQRIAVVERDGYQRNMGYEPGTNRWARALDGIGAATWRSEYPNLDLRHGRNLSKTRWSVAEFRDQRTCQGWTESDTIPGWGRVRGEMATILARGHDPSTGVNPCDQAAVEP